MSNLKRFPLQSFLILHFGHFDLNVSRPNPIKSARQPLLLSKCQQQHKAPGIHFAIESCMIGGRFSIGKALASFPSLATPLPAWLTVPVPRDLFYAGLVKLSKCHQKTNRVPTQGGSGMNQRGVAANRNGQIILKRERWTTTQKKNIDSNLIVLFPKKKKKKEN